MQKNASFGEFIRELRERQGIPIRIIAAQLDIDPSTLSKIERNERAANREHVKKLSQIFQIDEKILLVDYLSDKLIDELLYEDISAEVFKAAERKIKYLRAKQTHQGDLKF